MWLPRMRHLCFSLVHDTQSTAKGHRNHWWLTIILFDLFGFPAPPYQAVIPSVIHQKDTIATIRACQGHFQHIGTKMGYLWGLFCRCDKQNKLHAKHSATIFLCAYWFDLSTNGKSKKRTSSEITCNFFQIIKTTIMWVVFNDDKLQSIKRNTTACDKVKYWAYFKASWFKLLLRIQPTLKQIGTPLDSAATAWVRRATSRRARPK